MILVFGLLLVAGAFLTCYAAYWLLLLATHFLAPGRPATLGDGRTRFAVLIPAHNEELLLPRLLESVRRQEYPAERFDAYVIADNCTDSTSVIARDHAVHVLERLDTERMGKGYAIGWALNQIRLDEYDAALIVDADCTMSPNALRSLDGALKRRRVIQCHNGVGNPDESWFTRLLDVSRTVNNRIYNPSKQRLGLSCELTGTGMCFAVPILRQYPWDAYSVGEDWEYYAKLVQAGEIVGFDVDAKILHEESLSLKQATSQRMRWSSGRFAIVFKYGFRLLLRGLSERNLVKFDAGLCLVFPNPSLAMNSTLLCIGISMVAWPWSSPAFSLWFLTLALLQLGVFVTGVFYTQHRTKKLLAIFVSPAFLVWKMGIDALSILGVGRKKWVRTERKGGRV